MPWKCGQCGTENDDKEVCCGGGCGELRVAKCCRLITDRGQIAIHLPTRIGRRALRRLDANAAAAVSDQQFAIAMEAEFGGWVLRHLSTAVSDTKRNGLPVPVTGVLLVDGDQISVGSITLRVSLGNS